MANLKEEYTDIKRIKHRVEHLIVSGKDVGSREQMVDDLFRALTRSSKHISAA